MAKIKHWPLACCMFGLLAMGCGEAKSVSGKGRGATGYGPSTEMATLTPRKSAPTTGLGADNRITGSHEYNTGRATEPQPKALEKDITAIGTVSAAGAGTLTINLAGGGSQSFQTDENTQVFRAGDSRFFALEGGVGGIGEGTPVSVMGFNKGGQNYARAVSVGEGGFIVDKNKKK